jgi:histidine triad (HIT) family protein
MHHPTDCVFCQIVAGRAPATIIAEDELTIAFLDLRQFHPGHVLIIPRAHVPDIRDADDATAAAVLMMVARISRAVDKTFPCDGLSIWHSAGEAANQEVPHLHFHVHPRVYGDNLLDVYPEAPTLPSRETLTEWGARLRVVLTRANENTP